MTTLLDFSKNGKLSDSYRLFQFPMGEWHVQLSNVIQDKVIIKVDWPYSLEAIALLVDACRRKNPKCKITLFIPYFPYARQDRVSNSGEALSAKVCAEFINYLKLEKVVIVDPHSDVVPALLNNVYVINQWDVFPREWSNINYYDYVVAPDAGAVKKSAKVAEFFGAKLVCASKVRDTKTGRLSSFSCPEVSGNVLVVDDICDGGGTFNGFAKVIDTGDIGTLDLYVTHGGFTKGLADLLVHYSRIITTNSIKRPKGLDEELEIIDIFDERIEQRFIL